MELSNKVNYPVKDKSGVVKQKILSKNFSFGSNKSELLEKLIKVCDQSLNKEFAKTFRGAKIPEDQKNDVASNRHRARGNTFYGQQNYYEAARCYHDAICAAKTPAVRALAFSNRGWCWYNVGRYDSAQIDCERALELCGADKREKFEQRLETVRVARRDWVDVTEHKVSGEFKSDFGHIKVLENDKKHKYVVATKSLSKGMDILEEKFLVATTNASNYHSICTKCLCQLELLVCCDNCSRRYCNNECKQSDDNHICKIQLKLMQMTPAYIYHSYNVYKCYQRLNRLEELESFADSVELPSRAVLAEVPVWAMRVASTDDSIDKKLFLLTCFIVRQNYMPVFAYANGMGKKLDVGVAFCPTAVRFNHSCDPNVEFHFEKGTLFVTALRDIDEGEELCVSYGPTINNEENYKVRQTQLYQRYFFNCNCKACDEKQFEDKSLIDQRRRTRVQIETLSKKLNVCSDSKKASELTKALLSKVSEVYGVGSLQFTKKSPLFFFSQTRAAIIKQARVDFPVEDFMQQLLRLKTQLENFGRASNPELAVVCSLLTMIACAKAARQQLDGNTILNMLHSLIELSGDA